ncbi:hypothetical protein BDR22DRAFT_242246 [Usnea florida]
MVPADFSIMGEVLELLKEFPRTRHDVDARHKGSGLVMFPTASPSRLSPHNRHGIPEAPIPTKNPTYRTEAKTFEQEELRGLHPTCSARSLGRGGKKTKKIRKIRNSLQRRKTKSHINSRSTRLLWRMMQRRALRRRNPSTSTAVADLIATILTARLPSIQSQGCAPHNVLETQLHASAMHCCSFTSKLCLSRS